jgi:Cu/Zn superoxide dismutase
MRKISLIAVAAALACGGSSNTNANTYVANMTPTNEVPPATGSTASGTATFTVNGTNVDFVVTFTGLKSNVSAAHIHSGAAGTANAPVTSPFPLPSPAGTSGTITGSFPASDIKEGSAASGIHAGDLNSLIAAMKSGNAYANVHSSATGGGFPNGEIRGQINPK